MYLVLTILVYQCKTQHVLLKSFWWIRSFKLLRWLTCVLALLRSISIDLMWTFKSINITILSLMKMTKAMYFYLLIFPVFTPAYYSCFHSPWVLSLTIYLGLYQKFIYTFEMKQTWKFFVLLHVLWVSKPIIILLVITYWKQTYYYVSLRAIRHNWYEIMYQLSRYRY